MGSAPITAPDIAEARRKVVETDFFALCHLMLCQLSYSGEDNIKDARARITTRLPNLPTPPDAVDGKWKLAWGPEITDDNSNLMFAAEFVTKAGERPVYSTIVIRGTDVESSPAGILKQIFEDFHASEQTAFPENNTLGAKISAGTDGGLQGLLKMQDGGRNITQYANDFAGANPDAPIVVTGHSLGGCQSTVMAMHLSLNVKPAPPAPPPPIVPVTFAAPSAGNQAFANLYEQKFPASRRWFNNIDLVPMAFAQLQQMEQLWEQCGRPMPGLFQKIIQFYREEVLGIQGIDYVQPATHPKQLDGECQPPNAPLLIGTEINDVNAFILNAFGAVAQKFASVPFLHPRTPDLVNWFKELLFQHLIYTGYWDAVHDYSQEVGKFGWPFPLKPIGQGI